MLALQRTLTPSTRGFDSHPAHWFEDRVPEPVMEGQADVVTAAVSKTVERDVPCRFDSCSFRPPISWRVRPALVPGARLLNEWPTYRSEGSNPLLSAATKVAFLGVSQW